MSIWIEEPLGEEFELEEEESEDSQLPNKTKYFAKQISRRVSMAVIVKWLYYHSKEPHRQTEIWQAVGLNQATVSYNLNRLAKVGIVDIVRLEGLDSHPLYHINRRIAKYIVQRYLWLVSFQLIKAMQSKKEMTLEEIKANREILVLMRKYHLNEDEVIESLNLNKRYVEPVYSRHGSNELTGFKLKEVYSPLPYKETEISPEISVKSQAEELM